MKIYSVQLQFMKNKKAHICEICDNKEKGKKKKSREIRASKILNNGCHHRSICRAMIF